MDQPIACTLNPGQYRGRIDDLAALATRALRSREPIDGGERLTFADDEQTERALRTAVAQEASCCAFLRMDLQRREADLVLDVTGPRDARPIIAELFASR